MKIYQGTEFQPRDNDTIGPFQCECGYELSICRRTSGRREFLFRSLGGRTFTTRECPSCGRSLADQDDERMEQAEQENMPCPVEVGVIE